MSSVSPSITRRNLRSISSGMAANILRLKAVPINMPCDCWEQTPHNEPERLIYAPR